MTANALKALPKRERVAPRASILIESMRDIGYSLQTAVSDIIDNSITAGARNIELLADTSSDFPAIGILDDGSGMSDSELLEAMRPGTQSPLENRTKHDLGRFGLGLKTASFSQCRRLTVLTRKAGVVSCATWDLDIVAETDKWYVELPDNTTLLPWAEKLQNDGTLVIWQVLDRLVDPQNAADRSNLVRQLDETASHIELVFHRFLSGEPGLGRISISLNGRKLEPFDPFHSKHPATQLGSEDVFRIGKYEISIQPVTLPHHTKVNTAEWKRHGGKEGYIKNQGFYLYREKRLIIHGTWFNLAQQSELTKLARVRIDIPNGMDAEWKIDVKKASAQPPALVRNHLRKLVENLGAASKRTYTFRGKKLTSEDRLPVWVRCQNKNDIFYSLNSDHPAFSHFSDSLSDEQKQGLSHLLGLIESTIPIDTLFADVGSYPEEVSTKALDDDNFENLVKKTWLVLKSSDFDDKKIREMMASAEPFRSSWKVTEQIINMLKEEQVQ